MSLEFIKQHKGKALEKVPLSKRHKGNEYYLSIKYDGQMVQIAYDGEYDVRMWSSNGHEFYNEQLARDIRENQKYSFHVEAEYIGTSEGKLGDRGESSKITTYRTEFAKGIASKGTVGESFKVFDILSFDGQDVRSDPFSARYGMLMQLNSNRLFDVIPQLGNNSLEHSLNTDLPIALTLGYEGIILTHKDHIIGSGGRSNDRIKLKATPTLYAIITGSTPGTAAREGTIGSLTVKDEDGFEFSAGTGLNSEEWVLDPATLIGQVVKIAYESVDPKSGAYIQPRYLGAVNADKSLRRLSEEGTTLFWRFD